MAEIGYNHAVDAVGVYGHKDPDLDCLTAMWLFDRFLLKERFPERESNLQFVGHAQLIKIAEDHECFPVIVDGGKIYDPEHYRFDTHGDVRLKKECAASLVAREINEKDRQDLTPLVESVRAFDTGVPPPFPTLLPHFFSLLRGTHGPIMLAQIWFGVLDKWYGQAVLAPIQIEDALTFTKIFGSVVVTPHNAPRNISTKLFQKGYTYIVYETDYGTGVVARERLPFRFAQRVVERLEELNRASEFETWFFHPSGRMACRGSSKSPVVAPSALSTADLVAIAHGLDPKSLDVPGL